MPRHLAHLAAAASAAVLLIGLTACSGAAPQTGPSTPRPTPTAAIGVAPSGEPSDIVTGLAAPWSMLQLGDSSTGSRTEYNVLISERDTGVIQRITDPSPGSDGGLVPVGTVPGVVHEGESGLLGLAYLDDGDDTWVYAYLTTADDNRIVRMPYDADAISAETALGEPEVVLSGLAKARNHDGGRIAFGPDGMLYATVGDAGQPDLAQDPASLNGKILRMTPTGDVPDDNPIADSLVYSLGHRNPQGIAWDADGQLWAAEFGQDTWDEFNRIEPGGNYGWPVVEGVSTGSTAEGDYIDPWVQWNTDEASPRGLTFVDGTFFMAGLGGEQLWAITVDEAAGTAGTTAYFPQQFGRIRDVAPGPGGTLWFLTNNTDGRGDPQDGDDRIMSVDLAPLSGMGVEG